MTPAQASSILGPCGRGMSMRLARNAPAAEELLQAAACRILERVRIDGRSLLGLLKTVMMRIWWDQGKTAQAESLDIVVEDSEGNAMTRMDILPAVADDPADVAERNIGCEEMRTRMAALSNEHRSIIEWGCGTRLSYRDLSKKFRVPMGTIRSRLSRARAAMVRMAV